MLKIKIQLDSIGFDKKPSADEIKQVRNRLVTTELTLEEIVEAIEQGKTICPAVLNGTRSTDFVEQQLFLVDVDNEQTELMLPPQKAIEHYIEHGITPAFWYPTFSNTDKHPKYRIGFVYERPITDKTKRNKVQEILQFLIPQSDTSCKDAARIFFGTNKKVVIL